MVLIAKKRSLWKPIYVIFVWTVSLRLTYKEEVFIYGSRAWDNLDNVREENIYKILEGEALYQDVTTTKSNPDLTPRPYH